MAVLQTTKALLRRITTTSRTVSTQNLCRQCKITNPPKLRASLYNNKTMTTVALPNTLTTKQRLPSNNLQLSLNQQLLHVYREGLLSLSCQMLM